MQNRDTLNMLPVPRVRNIEASHIADLIRIAEETNLSHWSAQSYLDEMKNPDSIMRRLESDDNSTLGFVVGRLINGGMIETQLEAEIYNIAVVRSLQNKGYGQLLLDSFISICREKRAAQIWLEVRSSNRQAIGFYEKNGFENTQTRNNFYNNPREHALLMRVTLKQEDA